MKEKPGEKKKRQKDRKTYSNIPSGYYLKEVREFDKLFFIMEFSYKGIEYRRESLGNNYG